MHLLDKTVNGAITTGILLSGLALALVFWFLAYTQTKVEAFNESAPIGAVLEDLH